ncbi:hypothetical protein [Thermovenabulum gondwanense]|uniref:Uncharacterized protein n=1 Tax=Thermovenabulum gondwanense TaxID=520767 RepID=A0A162MGK9_9FIRM|nr:hypothetical protein [Thermovenabulum gondwanense]KYO65793.1 hypothetical protein ATZ99_14310 [Thermovenabulum gondwanense]
MANFKTKLLIAIICFLMLILSFGGLFYYREIKNKIPKSAKFVIVLEENIDNKEGKNINVINFWEG